MGEEDGKWLKLKLKGKKLNGLFFVAQQEGSKMWTFAKSAMQEPKVTILYCISCL